MFLKFFYYLKSNRFKTKLFLNNILIIKKFTFILKYQG